MSSCMTLDEVLPRALPPEMLAHSVAEDLLHRVVWGRITRADQLEGAARLCGRGEQLVRAQGAFVSAQFLITP